MNEREKRNNTAPAHPYIPHLLQDIKAAHRTGESKPVESFEDYIEEVERYIHGDYDPDKSTFGKYCGLEVRNFPPPEQLTHRDIELVCDAFEEMLHTWNAHVSLPENVPHRLRYNLTIGILDEEYIPMNIGFITFDFCDGYAPECPLEEYCPCLEIWNDDDDNDGI